MTHVRLLARWLFGALLATVSRAQTPPAAPPSPPPPSAEAAPAGVRNLVIVTIDTVRSDRMSCYGYFRPTTPNLDRLAKESLRFTHCLTPVAQTTPSHTSIFTGVGPFEHGVLSNHARKSKDEREELKLRTSATLRTLAEAFRERGTKTGGFVTATPVKRFTGIAAGFDKWTEPIKGRRFAHEAIVDATKFIDGCGASPFFVWVHLYDAHEPLEPPTPPKSFCELYHDEPQLTDWLHSRGFPDNTEELEAHGRTVALTSNLYDGALSFLDKQLAALLERLDQPDLAPATALVVIADHGTSIGQHGHMGHGIVWDEQLRVPLLIKVPGVLPSVVDVAMSTLDLWPTLCGLAPALADERFLAQCRGSDVLASGYQPRPLFAVSGRHGDLVASTAGRWKLMRPAREPAQLFDLTEDPAELVDVAAQHPEVVARLGKLIDEDLERQRRANELHGRPGTSDGEVDPKLLEELRALGYVDLDDGSDDGKPDGSGGSAAPKKGGGRR